MRADPDLHSSSAPGRSAHARNRRQLWGFLAFAYVLYGFGWLWPQHYRVVSSAYVATSWIAFMVRALAFQLGLFLLVIVVWAFLTHHRRAALAAVPLLVMTIALPLVQGSESSARPATRGVSVRVMTVNLLVGNPEHAAVADEILIARPDVVLLQEYSSDWHDYLAGRLRGRYPHVRYETRDDSFGTAIYSRRPFRDAESEHAITLGDGETPQSRSVVRIGGRDVAIYDVHLLPPTNLGYVREGRVEFADLVDLVDRDPLPVIVAGDLNVTATAPQHHALRAHGLHDAWELTRTGRGATWPADSWRGVVMGVRLDHLYLSKQLTATRVRIGDPNGSDHRPVVADIALRGDQAS